jgi:hypothetical protein
MCIYTYMHPYIHTYIHIYMHTYICIFIYVPSLIIAFNCTGPGLIGIFDLDILRDIGGITSTLIYVCMKIKIRFIDIKIY